MNEQASHLPSVANLAELAGLLEEHRPRLLAMLRRRVDPDLSVQIDADDILSDAFLQARRRWQAFREQPALTPYAWLYRIVLDCLIEAWRRATRDRRDLRKELPFPEQSSIQLGLGIVSPGTSPSQAAARHELQERMRQALALLKEQDREILWMRHFDQLSFAEAAMVLGVTESGATTRYARALRRLRDLWERLHFDQG
jgi:RNA polymerase sigma-70 factor (ECF subfamily)